ncbi:aldehyde dehydrogenase family protein [Pseudoalteromonas sp. T1lg23B]|uniref:aldehyde dehydrogenase family protein n=1 Tax=Pseudoalteromonas sp. T1lg23B TaxID=2077097 RepID=UPI000CF72484|nr:aldehyde dehydrogenase family protein [Pseudoalteromonas sp. T1lg23B]
MQEIIQLNNIINGNEREAEERKVAGRFSFPVTTDQDLSFALKLTRVQKSQPINKVIEALSKIGRDANWITDEDLKIQAELSGSPIKHMRKSIDVINTWLAGLKDYVQINGKLKPVQGTDEPKEVLLDDKGMLFRGGLSTMFVLAGDEVAIAPWNIAQAMLADSRAIVKPSKIEPLSAYLFTKAIIAEGLTPPSLLYISRDSEAEQDLVKKAIKLTQQSVIYGEDHTVDAICGPFGFRVDHKSITFLTGRSGAIVWDDADVQLTAAAIVRGATDDRGNRCNSTKKVFAPRAMASALQAAMVAEADKLVRGAPQDDATDLGRSEPQAREIAQGWTSSGQVFYDRDMFFMTVEKEAPVLREEIPYPTVSVCYYDEGEDPVELANESVRGTPLGASIALSLFTSDENRYLEAASRLDTCKALHNLPSTEFDFWTTHQRLHLFTELMRRTELITNN